jgi:hypothetical protein
MPLNVMDLQDTQMKAAGSIEKWRAEFDKRWNEPATRAAIAYTLAQLPPEIQAKLKEMTPAAFADVEKRYMNGGK